MEKSKNFPIECPQCHGDEIKKLSLVYETTIQSITATGMGMGYLGSLSGHSHSVLAERIAPPKSGNPETNWYLFFSGLLISLALPIVIMLLMTVFHFFNAGIYLTIIIVLLGLGIFLMVKSSKEGRKKAKLAQEKALKEWNASWFCNRCGNIFIP